MEPTNNKNDEQEQFSFDEEFDEGNIFIEIPAEQRSSAYDIIPSGYDPMGEIYLRGRAFRGLSSGGAPWWIIIAGWLIFGGVGLLIFVAFLPEIIANPKNLFSLIPLIFIFLPIYIVWRGTMAKLSRQKRRRR